MPNINNRYKKLYIMLHLLLGVLLFYFPYLSSYIGLLVIAYSTYLILFHKNYYKFAPIICSAYIVGFEVLLRMSNSFLFWEFGKLSIIYIISIGFFVLIIARYLTGCIVLSSTSSISIFA